MKIAFVVQRYGEEVNGGAELHCRQVAERLSKYFKVEVITTCAIDYVTWKDEYSSGQEVLNGVIINRFAIDAPRNSGRFNRFSEKIFGKPHTKDDEIRWMELQGPYSTPLLEFIVDNKDKYDYFIFFTYLYCTTYFGLPLVKDKAILVPTAHDEPPIYLGIFNELFQMPEYIVYNTEWEKNFVQSKFKNTHISNDVVGVGIDPIQNLRPDDFIEKYNLDGRFILYVGRIDESKGCKVLFDYFLKYKKSHGDKLKLVLVGKPVMNIPKNKYIISLGFVTDEDKYGAISACDILINSSPFESLSMVLLEAWSLNKPTLVNGNCGVLKDHCILSNGGLYYSNYAEFESCLDLMLSNRELCVRMGENGRRYVEANYGWDVVEGKYLRLLDGLKDKNA
ncbi:MAG: glycosyltransferase family 4 protein [Desulfobacula sp.]|nr:glycosyltransferase family 4 protein [Desulfobacula sp.]